MVKENSLTVFEGKEVRKVWHNEEWWFSIIDIVAVLTDSIDPKQYIKKMHQRDPVLNANWGTICTPLELTAPDGKKRETNCVNTEGAFRVIQSIPSLKAEPFKLWLAKIGYERIQEIENPELAQDRAKGYYELKGYPKEWIDKRIRGIAIRQELTDEWKARGIKENKEFAILTNEISKATFGVPIKIHKEIKGLDPKFKNQNLRDHAQKSLISGIPEIFNFSGYERFRTYLFDVRRETDHRSHQEKRRSGTSREFPSSPRRRFSCWKSPAGCRKNVGNKSGFR